MTGTVKMTKECNYIGHGGTWLSLSSACCIGLSTARGYAKLFMLPVAVVAVLKPVYMPGKPCAYH